MRKMDAIDWGALVLLIIGGLNWGVYGLFNRTDLVDLIFGGYNIVSRIIYVLVGISALYMIYFAATKT
ncbi:MAG: DUF378 domain-containing protein [Candidatus Nanoarchaeia archaeon]